MSYHRISDRAVKALLSIRGDVPLDQGILRAFDELAATQKRKPLREAVKASRQQRALKRESKRDETAKIRREVFAFADGRCDMCGANPPTDLHHAFGRVRVKQSASNCLALCRVCHRVLTDNVGGAERCWAIQANIFSRKGRRASAGMAARNAIRAADKARLSAASEEAGRGAR